ncbi:YfiM family lipoprotein [Pseudomonas aeruginosa]|uniref:YfiM family lipoprotein n=1 Tax=Pseudomonas aeruginosa TaxID=287 RepID=UPI0005BBD579|nr:YfiM family lipoprotein [Pseudomonas aeruginosa]MBF3186956.1 YfiM family lipoprotein [Pseudomonas aeruginosa]MBG6452899.1 YfiM family lipoprotein [Pseudomonas aeruginosa]MBH9220781.1 YfiM family lipoprotein [Pseudomonas aeruginosa]MCO3254485.1 YfiM family lipoprotein [Pseudomonas aeruginosa]MDQ6231350.1 YfiM family lipoprotein [Pseudomonas aeruginosa]
MRALLVAACLLLGGCSHFAEDDWLGEDKALHFASSAALAAAGMQMAHDRGLRGVRQARFGLSFSLAFGVGKEFYDSRSAGSGWSWKDLAWDLAGAAAGYGLYQAAE